MLQTLNGGRGATSNLSAHHHSLLFKHLPSIDSDPSQQQIRPRSNPSCQLPTNMDDFQTSDLDDIPELTTRCNDHVNEACRRAGTPGEPSGPFWYLRFRYWVQFAHVALLRLKEKDERIQSLEKESSYSQARAELLEAELQRSYTTLTSLSQALANVTSSASENESSSSTSLDKNTTADTQQSTILNLEVRVEELEALVKTLAASAPFATPTSTVPTTPIMTPTTTATNSTMGAAVDVVRCLSCSKDFSHLRDYQNHTCAAVCNDMAQCLTCWKIFYPFGGHLRWDERVSRYVCGQSLGTGRD